MAMKMIDDDDDHDDNNNNNNNKYYDNGRQDNNYNNTYNNNYNNDNELYGYRKEWNYWIVRKRAMCMCCVWVKYHKISEMEITQTNNCIKFYLNRTRNINISSLHTTNLIGGDRNNIAYRLVKTKNWLWLIVNTIAFDILGILVIYYSRKQRE